MTRLNLVLLSLTDKCWKISDFGISQDGSYYRAYETCGRGTQLYQSPELLRRNDPIASTGSDVWSLGCILHELAFDAKAFPTEYYVSEYYYSKRPLDLASLPIKDRLACYISELIRSSLDRDWWNRPPARALLKTLETISQPEFAVQGLSYPQLIRSRLDLDRRQLQYLGTNYPQLKYLRLNFPHLRRHSPLTEPQPASGTDTCSEGKPLSLLPFFKNVFHGSLWHDDGYMREDADTNSPSVKIMNDSSEDWKDIKWRPYWYSSHFCLFI